jgi:myo-inositol-1(or 4)-monophosphatase
VREAGGRTNDFLANDGLRQGNLLYAVTPEIHDRVTALLKVDPGHAAPSGR